MLHFKNIFGHKKIDGSVLDHRLFIKFASGREFLNPLSPGFIAPWLKLCLHQKLHLILIKAKQLLDGAEGDLIRQSHFDYFVFVFQFRVPVFKRHSRWPDLGLSAPSGRLSLAHLKKVAKASLVILLLSAVKEYEGASILVVSC